MKFVNSKPASTIEMREIPLGGYSEPALLLVLGGLLPQSDIDPNLALILQPVVSGCRAELVRRWQKRGAPLAITLPARLPAIVIEASAHLFHAMVENLKPQAEIARDAGPLLAPTLAQLSGAIEIAASLLRALEDCRIQLPAIAEAGQ